jgi:hypothetical protein
MPNECRFDIARAFPLIRWWRATLGSLLCYLLISCGGGSDAPLAERSNAAIGTKAAGATPFIAFAEVLGQELNEVSSVSYRIAPKAGRLSKAVAVTYSRNYLAQRGYANSSSKLTLPIFGLYANHENTVDVTIAFADNSSSSLTVVVSTPAYADPSGVYDRPSIIKQRALADQTPFDYFYAKSQLGTPVIIDSDAEIRWVGHSIANSTSSLWTGNAFIVGSAVSTTLSRLELDGTIRANFLPVSSYTFFHHNIDPGKTGLLIEPDATVGGVKVVESIVSEVGIDGTFVKEWDFAAIVARHMRERGDDPALFVRPGIDWFHVNSAIYDSRDDTIIASSRENFVIKVDYSTGSIIWILGDPTKYWYSFGSLRDRALAVEDGGLYPIGQHSLSITPDGLLLMFNNGLGSVNQPAESAAGESRAYSTASAYTIDPIGMKARETWQFDHDKSVLSDICSSVSQAADGSLLLSYAAAANRTSARIVAVNAAHQTVFDYEYKTPDGKGPCAVSWNAQPIAMTSLSFD